MWQAKLLHQIAIEISNGCKSNNQIG